MASCNCFCKEDGQPIISSKGGDEIPNLFYFAKIIRSNIPACNILPDFKRFLPVIHCDFNDLFFRLRFNRGIILCRTGRFIMGALLVVTE